MKKNNIIKIYISVITILIVFVLIFNETILKGKTFIEGFMLPTQSKIYKFGSKIINIKEAIFSYSDISEKNQKLEREVAELKFKILYTELMEKENQRLLNLLNLQENNIYKTELKLSRVIFRDIQNLYNNFYIDKGLNDGIEIDMIVIYGEQLIGKIKKVEENYSEVEMITSFSNMVSSRTKEGILGIARGSDEQNGIVYFEPSTFEDNLDIGEEVYTSGISEIYPEGLKVGRIIEVDETEDYMFKSIKMKPELEIEKLKEVMVFKYKEKFRKDDK